MHAAGIFLKELRYDSRRALWFAWTFSGKHRGAGKTRAFRITDLRESRSGGGDAENRGRGKEYSVGEGKVCLESRGSGGGRRTRGLGSGQCQRDLLDLRDMARLTVGE